jgi:hypothetical protein
MMLLDPHSAAVHYLPRAAILAKNRCHSPSDRDDLTHEGIIGLMNAVASYNAQGKVIHSPDAFATSTMCRSMQMWNYYMYADRGCVIDYVDDVARLNIVGDDDLFFRVLEREFFDELERLHGTDIRTLAENLTLPGPEAVMVALERRVINLYKYHEALPVRANLKEVQVKHTDIRAAFGLSTPAWNQQLRIIRDHARIWFPNAAPVKN